MKPNTWLRHLYTSVVLNFVVLAVPVYVVCHDELLLTGVFHPTLCTEGNIFTFLLTHFDSSVTPARASHGEHVLTASIALNLRATTT
ncbi:hypothetical protein EDB19DRAFT_1739805 [Suillus lakei]|nr:hypothetical protein EDB19DRAFT_1739805 [Suillus lakei]